MISTAVVGLGTWGKTMVESLAGGSDLMRFTALQTRTVTPDVEAFAKQHSLRIAKTYEDVLTDSSIQAVALATPASGHLQQIEALKRTRKCGEGGSLWQRWPSRCSYQHRRTLLSWLRLDRALVLPASFGWRRFSWLQLRLHYDRLSSCLTIAPVPMDRPFGVGGRLLVSRQLQFSPWCCAPGI